MTPTPTPSLKTAAPHEIPYAAGTDGPPDVAKLSEKMAQRIDARLTAVSHNIQTARVTTAGLAAGASEVVKVTWPEAFADTNYTVSISVRRSSGSSPVAPNVQTFNKKAASIEVGVTNESAEGEQFVIEAIAVHD